MKLTQIRLSGFKSFADATTIRVPGRLVGVVGPNGCGKSNVIDAVRWVLGESSAKQLRGENMQDVIFNGAATRPAASRASVELVFDNADNALQGEWGRFAEIAVKRSLNRKGESAYFINNQQVRRKDITDLFLGTGVGARGYAVIEQGMISRIIEARPEELRGYIEEAAGVSKYKERRRETESRLKDSLENLARLSDIKAELEKQVEKLKRQAATAERYRKIKADLDLAHNRLDFLIWQNALADKEEYTNKIKELEEIITQLDDERSKLNEEIYAVQLAEYSGREQETELSRQAAALREEMARLEEQIRHHLSLQQRREKEQLITQTEMQQVQNRLTVLSQDIENTQILIDEKRLSAEETRLNSEQFAEHMPQVRQELEQSQANFNQLQIKINQLKQNIALKKHSLERNTAEMERLKIRLPEHSDLGAAEEDFSLQEQKVEELQLRYDTIAENLLTEEEKIFAVQSKITQNNQEHNAHNLRLTALDAEFAALSHLSNDKESHFWDNFPHLENTAIWKNLTIEHEWQQAVSAVLGDRLTARYAPDLTVDFSQHNLNSNAVWINQEIDHNAFRQPENNLQLFDNIDDNAFRQPERLIEKINANPPFSNVLGHWLDGVWCVENINTALQYQAWLPENHSFVTPDGHQISRIGVSLFGGNDSEQLLARQNRLNELLEEKNQLVPKIEALDNLSGSLKDELEQYQNRIVEIKNIQQNLLKELQQEQNHFIRIKTEYNEQQKRRAEKEKEQQETKQHIDLLNQDNQRLQEEIIQFEEEMVTLEEEQFIIEEQVDRLKIKFNQSQEKIIEVERLANQSELALKEVEQQLNSLQNEENHLKNRLEILNKKQAELSLETESEENDNEEKQRQRLSQLEQQYEEIELQLKSIQEEQNKRRKILDEMRQKADATANRLPEQQKQRENATLAAQQAELIAEQHYNRLSEREADFSALKNDAEHGLTQQELSQQVKDFSNKLNNIGAVNLAALDELADAENRQNELAAQYSDIENAVSQLKEAVAKIDQESRQLFKATFDAANENMQKYFPVLFGGGQAALTLTDNDLLSAGVSIIARPPGKKNSTIYLLSGGEKALTAMSLVFSLFSLNPAPFCLLDEVDAPLDDANTSRFCQLVLQMSDKTQFLYISHNRLTMENAEQLIGVTMQEKGVSRIVSVDIQQAIKMAEQ